MKMLKLTAVSAAVLLSSHAMANVVTDTGHMVIGGVKSTGVAVVNSGKAVVKTFSNPGAVSLEVGTLGYGANISWAANETTEVVAGWTGGSFDTDVDIGGNDSIINWKKVLGDEYKDHSGTLNIDADFSNPYIGVQVRPFSNRFAVGTGVIFQDNELNVTLKPGDKALSSVKINGVNYDVNGDIHVKAESGRDLAPYLTVGFKPNSDRRFGMFGEIGAAYSGKWKTSVDVQPKGEILKNGVVQANVEAAVAELEEKLQDKISDNNTQWYPIVKLGATYRF